MTGYSRDVRRPGRIVGAILSHWSSASRAVAWAMSVVGPALLALALRPIRGNGFGVGGYELLVLLIVVGAALAGGLAPALVTVLVGALFGAYVFAVPYDTFDVSLRVKNSPLLAFILVGVVVAILFDELARLVDEQTELRKVETSLRRVATLAASAAPTRELFGAATEEVGRLLSMDLARMGRAESDGSLTIVAGWAAEGDSVPVGSRWPVDPNYLAAMVLSTGHAARAESQNPSDVSGGILRDSSGIRSAVGAPITVHGRLWGVIAAGSRSDRPLPPCTEARLAEVTELLGTAIANAQSLDELAASRRRVVAAADDARRQLERDLHDGAQQQLLTLAIELRNAQAAVPRELSGLNAEFSRIVRAITDLQDELREISRGIHPAILAAGGIGPALRTLARRSSIPVRLDVQAASRLPAPIEVATYYVVSEAIANAAKHAHAAVVDVHVEADNGSIRISVKDDGAGGADPDRGSGLIGLKDRVEALGGTLEIRSPAGAGTDLEVEIPVAG
jgi:signal transduction histidine kinase